MNMSNEHRNEPPVAQLYWVPDQYAEAFELYNSIEACRRSRILALPSMVSAQQTKNDDLSDTEIIKILGGSA